MAKNYHPLDSRYKGPSTAYRGKPKMVVERTTFEAPATPTPTAPWGAPPPNASPASPPPVPQAIPVAPTPPRKGRGLWIIAIIVGLIVVSNLYISNLYGGLILDVQTELNTMDL